MDFLLLSSVFNFHKTLYNKHIVNFITFFTVNPMWLKKIKIVKIKSCEISSWYHWLWIRLRNSEIQKTDPIWQIEIIKINRLGWNSVYEGFCGCWC